MKRILLFALFFLITATSAQAKSKTLVGFSPFALINSAPNVIVEIPYQKNLSIGAGLMFSTDNSFTPITNVFARNYFTGKMNEFFAGAGLVFQDGANMYITTEFGYQWELMGSVQDMAIISSSNSTFTRVGYRVAWGF